MCNMLHINFLQLPLILLVVLSVFKTTSDTYIEIHITVHVLQKTIKILRNIYFKISMLSCLLQIIIDYEMVYI